jgi:hypothetical protein
MSRPPRFLGMAGRWPLMTCVMCFVLAQILSDPGQFFSIASVVRRRGTDNDRSLHTRTDTCTRRSMTRTTHTRSRRKKGCMGEDGYGKRKKFQREQGTAGKRQSECGNGSCGPISLQVYSPSSLLCRWRRVNRSRTSFEGKVCTPLFRSILLPAPYLRPPNP